jgi:hypothetical protein
MTLSVAILIGLVQTGLIYVNSHIMAAALSFLLLGAPDR